jgi:hypothetical protein
MQERVGSLLVWILGAGVRASSSSAVLQAGPGQESPGKFPTPGTSVTAHCHCQRQCQCLLKTTTIHSFHTKPPQHAHCVFQPTETRDRTFLVHLEHVSCHVSDVIDYLTGAESKAFAQHSPCPKLSNVRLINRISWSSSWSRGMMH